MVSISFLVPNNSEQYDCVHFWNHVVVRIYSRLEKLSSNLVKLYYYRCSSGESEAIIIQGKEKISPASLTGAHVGYTFYLVAIVNNKMNEHSIFQ